MLEMDFLGIEFGVLRTLNGNRCFSISLFKLILVIYLNGYQKWKSSIKTICHLSSVVTDGKEGEDTGRDTHVGDKVIDLAVH